jgi:S1-C subfamily serine protease
MKTCAVFAIYLLLLLPPPRANAQEAITRLTNDDVLKMVQAGLSTDLIVSKIKKSRTDFDTSPSALAALPKRGVPNEILLAMLESDPLGSNTHVVRKNGRRITAAEFQQLQASVLTVWSEFGSGIGFIISEKGLVLTSQHVIGPSEYLAVQFDRNRKIPAKLLAADPLTDVAVLWINLAAIPDAGVAPLADSERDQPSVVEGERVVTIGSPLHARKVFTTGIANKVDKRSIVSDITLNRADSGGPLFNSAGEAAGITTFLRPDVSGPGVYGILRIEQTFPLIEEARKKMKRLSAPLARFLPVDPSEPFPLDAIKTVPAATNFDMTRYSFDLDDFSVLVMTPTVRHRLATAAQGEALAAFEELRSWANYISASKPVLFIYVAPSSGESRADFYKMRLFCGDREVEPIHPAKAARVRAQEVTFRGIYAYSPTAISADCGTVELEIDSAGNPHKVRAKKLDRKLIARVDDDFSPYYQKYGRPPLALLESRAETDRTTSKTNKWWEFSKPPKQR